MPATARMLALPGETIIFCVDARNKGDLEGAGAAVVEIDAIEGRPDLSAVMEHLAQIEVNDVLVEAGPVLAGALLTSGLVDELVIYQAPHIMGSETRGMTETPGLLDLDQRIAFEVVDSSTIGQDTRLTLKPKK
jgi:diaminohydroxyphosphoribosylaminopyrimidine deaminase/5-amino-6-(5-phosphoribosylamino)uracil reductase